MCPVSPQDRQPIQTGPGKVMTLGTVQATGKPCQCPLESDNPGRGTNEEAFKTPCTVAHNRTVDDSCGCTSCGYWKISIFQCGSIGVACVGELRWSVI